MKKHSRILGDRNGVQFHDMTITVVKGMQVSEVISLLALDKYESMNATYMELEESPITDCGNEYVQVDALGDAVVLVEPNGWEFHDRDTLEELSAKGSATSIYWNVENPTSFCQAVNGKIVRDFRPGLDTGPEIDSYTGALLTEMSAEDEPLPEEGGLPFESDMVTESAILLMERLTNIEITDSWLLNAKRTSFIKITPP